MMSMERVYDMRRHVHVFVRDARVTQMDPRRRIHMSYEEEDTCVRA
jgi:hypothetical protein